MQPVKTKWLGGGLVLVCRRCSEERIPEETPDVAERLGNFSLRDWLKAKLKEDGRWGAIRAISTSCMDVCGKGRVTVCIDPETGPDHAEIFTLDPIAERDELYARIVDKLHTRNESAG